MGAFRRRSRLAVSFRFYVTTVRRFYTNVRMDTLSGIAVFLLVVLAAIGILAAITLVNARRRAKLTVEQRAAEDKELDDLFYW